MRSEKFYKEKSGETSAFSSYAEVFQPRGDFNPDFPYYETPYHLTKDNSYGNLTILHKSVQLLIHLRDQEKMQVLLNSLKLNEKQLTEVNKLRKQSMNEAI